jgi:hypothetical protein
MKKIIRLTENDLMKLVKRVIKEQAQTTYSGQPGIVKKFEKRVPIPESGSFPIVNVNPYDTIKITENKSDSDQIIFYLEVIYNTEDETVVTAFNNNRKKSLTDITFDNIVKWGSETVQKNLPKAQADIFGSSYKKITSLTIENHDNTLIHKINITVLTPSGFPPQSFDLSKFKGSHS